MPSRVKNNESVIKEKQNFHQRKKLNRSRSRSLSRARSKSNTRLNKAKQRSYKVSTRAEMKTTEPNEQENAANISFNNEKIEKLKKEIAELTSIDNFFKNGSSILDSNNNIELEIDQTTNEESITRSNSEIKIEKIETTAKRRRKSKTPAPDLENKQQQEGDDDVIPQQESKIDTEYKYSGYLRYTTKTLVSVIAASLLVLLLFIFISQSTHSSNFEIIKNKFYEIFFD